MLKGTVKGSVWSTKRVDDVPNGAFLEVELEAGGKIFLEQTDAVTTVLVASVKLLKTRPELAEKFRVADARHFHRLHVARALVAGG